MSVSILAVQEDEAPVRVALRVFSVVGVHCGDVVWVLSFA